MISGLGLWRIAHPKWRILFADIYHSIPKMYARNTNVRPHSRRRATVGRLTLVPGGGRVTIPGCRDGEAATADVSHTWVLRTVIAARGAARSGTSGAQPIVCGRTVIVFRLVRLKNIADSDPDPPESVERRQVVAVELLGRSDPDPVEVAVLVVAVRFNGRDDLFRLHVEDGEPGVDAGRGVGVTRLR